MKEFIRKTFYLLKNKSILINGKKRKIPAEMHLHYSLTKNNIVEDHLVSFLKKVIFPGATFIDIGANVGWISLEAASLAGKKGKVYSLEPIKHLCSLFEKLIMLNNLKNIFVINAAAGAEEGFTEINVSEVGSAFQERSSLIQVDREVDKQEIMVLPVDQFFNSKNIDFIKIDVEGFELEVLKGAIKTIEKHRPTVLIEVHGLYFNDSSGHVKSVYEFFESREYVSANIVNQKIINYKEFMNDTLIEGTDPLTGKDLKNLGYGQLAFIPKENQILKKLQK